MALPACSRPSASQHIDPREKWRLDSSDRLVLQHAHHDATIFRLSLCALVGPDLVGLSHRARRQDTRQRNMPLLKQHVRHIVGTVFT